MSETTDLRDDEVVSSSCQSHCMDLMHLLLEKCSTPALVPTPFFPVLSPNFFLCGGGEAKIEFSPPSALQQ